MTRIAYMRAGQLFYATRKRGESIVNAVARAVGNKVGPVTLWWSECRDGHDVYTAKWFDTSTDTFQEASIII